MEKGKAKGCLAFFPWINPLKVVICRGGFYRRPRNFVIVALLRKNMPEMPAFCDNCSAIFGSGFVFENCRSVHLYGNKAGPCPNCGSLGSIPDGIFEMTGNAIRLLHGTAKTIGNLNRLTQILTNAQKSKLTKEQVESEINREVPELSSFASILPKTRNELYAFIAIILTVIGLIMAGVSKEESLRDSEVERIVDQVIYEAILNSKKQK